MKIFETHAHYDDEVFDEDREVLFEKMLNADGVIGKIVNVGATMRGCEESIRLAEKYSQVYAAIGIHPSETGGMTGKDLEWLEKQAVQNDKIVAIGEIGLDYHYEEPSGKIQTEWFVNQLQLARKVKKPVVIHSREACSDTLEVMKNERASDIGGIVHCYSYSRETAKELLDMGFYFGIGGVVTFKNARKLVEAVEYIPMDRIVLETDSPYMSPEPFRGKRNDSLRIPYIADKIAQLKGISSTEVIDEAYRNACEVFRIKE